MKTIQCKKRLKYLTEKINLRNISFENNCIWICSDFFTIVSMCVLLLWRQQLGNYIILQLEFWSMISSKPPDWGSHYILVSFPQSAESPKGPFWSEKWLKALLVWESVVVVAVVADVADVVAHTDLGCNLLGYHKGIGGPAVVPKKSLWKCWCCVPRKWQCFPEHCLHSQNCACHLHHHPSLPIITLWALWYPYR